MRRIARRPPPSVPSRGGSMAQQLQENRIAQQQQEENRIAQQLQEENRIAQQLQEENRIAQQQQEENRIAQLQEENRIAQLQEENRIAQQLQEENRMAQQEQEWERMTQQQQEENRMAQQEQDWERMAQQQQEENRAAQQQQEQEWDRVAQQLEENRIAEQQQEENQMAQQLQQENRMGQQLQEENRIAQQLQEEWGGMAQQRQEEEEDGRRGRGGVAVIKDGKYSDLTITLTGSNASYRVHKIYLAMASPVLEELIDALPPLRQNHLLLPENGPPEAFHWLLRFVYGTEPPIECRRLAVKVACLVGKYRVKELYPICLEWLDDILEKGMLLEVYNAAYLLRNSLLVTKCIQLLLTCADEVLSSQQVCCLTKEALMYLLQQHLYVQSEAIILNAVLAWGRSQLPQQQRACGTALYHRIKHLLPHVRLLTLSAEEIVRWLMPSGVYSPKECQAILYHRTQTSGAPPLPESCSPLLTRRRCLDAFPLSRVRLPGAPASRDILLDTNTLPLLLSSGKDLVLERVLVSSLSVDAAVVLQGVECRGIEMREVRAVVRDAAGSTLYMATMGKTGDEGFDVPVALDPTKICTVTAKLVHYDEYYIDGVHPFSAEAAGVHFKGGQGSFLDDRCYLYFWHLDHCLSVDL